MGNTTTEKPALPTTAASTTLATETPPPIPRLVSLAPAIFVPVNKILPNEEALEQFASLAATDRAEHMRQALARSDKHASAVRGNLLTLFRREHMRVLQAIQAEEPPRHEHMRDRQDHEQHGWTASPADLERMIASMAAPAPAPPPRPDPQAQVVQIIQGKGGAAAKRDAGDPIGDVPEPSFTHRVVTSPSELAARESLILVSKATTELRNYDAHIAPKREMRRRALDRESAQRRKVPREVE